MTDRDRSTAGATPARTDAAASAPGSLDEPRQGVPVWRRVADLRLVFHHTDPESARHIAEHGFFKVGRASFYGPTGIYAAIEHPETLTLTQIRAYFFNTHPEESLGGVVVLAADDPDEPFINQADSVWVLEGPPGWRPIGDLVVGWGRRTSSGDWEWSPSLLD